MRRSSKFSFVRFVIHNRTFLLRFFGAIFGFYVLYRLTSNSIEDYAKGINFTCEYRADRLNPREHPEKFPCPVQHEWGWLKNENIEVEPWDVGSAEQLSSRVCTSDNFCEYKNVCLRGPERKVLYFKRPSDPITKDDFGWWPYRDGDKKSFTWNYKVELVDVPEAPPDQRVEYIKRVDGTTVWFDQSYGNICHPGHSSEFYFKLVQLRNEFPGKVSRIFYAKDTEFKDRQDAYQYCYIPCNMMRIAFPDMDFTFPPIYWVQNQTEFRVGETVCFDRLLVPANTHQHFTSTKALSQYRSQALKMCGIKERKQRPEKPSKVFFYSRGFDRQIYNNPEICYAAKDEGYQAYLETDDHPSYCQQIAAMHAADIIVSIDGSSNHLLAYAHPHSVLIMVYPFNFRAPDWKVLAHLAELRVLELMTVDKRLSISHPVYKKPNEAQALNTSLLGCTGYNCRSQLRHHSTKVPVDTFVKFLRRAVELWDEPLGFYEHCEQSLPWPIVPTPRNSPEPYFHLWRQYCFAMNYEVCDLPPPDCVCCKSQDCVDATTIRRGF